MARSFAALRRGLDQITYPFFHWWTSELVAVFQAARRVAGLGETRTIVARTDGGVRVFVDRNGNRQPLLGGAVFTDIGQAVERGLAREKVGKLVLRLRPADCFARTVELPRAANRDVPRILALDLERTTPFKTADVMTAAHVVGDTAADRLIWRQYIVKKTLVRPLVDSLERAGLTVDAVDCGNEDDRSQIVAFSSADTGTVRTFPVRLAAGIAALIVALSASAMTLDIIRLQTALTELRAETSRAKAAADAARQVNGRAEAVLADADRLLRSHREAVPRTVVIEELSRILPDNVWLTELRIEGGVVEVSGYAPAAAGLVPILGRSSVLEDPALTASVTYDAREGRERFSLRARVRGVPTPTRGG